MKHGDMSLKLEAELKLLKEKPSANLGEDAQLLRSKKMKTKTSLQFNLRKILLLGTDHTEDGALRLLHLIPIHQRTIGSLS